MKKSYILCIFFIAFAIKGYSQTPFTTGNLVVYKVGDSTDALSSAAFPVNLDEYTTGGIFVASHRMPTAVSGSNKRITASGSAGSEGQMTRSADSNYLIVPGYDTTLLTASVSGTAAKRVVGVVSHAGVVDASTALTDAYLANNFRGATSTNGTDLWLAGTGTGTSAGVRYASKGSSTSTEISTTSTNINAVNIFNGQLYSTSSKTTFLGVAADGTGEPKTTGNTITLLPGFPTSGSSDPRAFSINPSTTIAYVADDRVTASGGGVQKWILSSGTWSLTYTLKTNLTAGTTGLTVDWSGSNPVIYAVTADTPVNKIVAVTDAGSSSSFTTLATAATNYIFRGIAFAPIDTVPLPITLLDFNAALNGSTVELEWATAEEINTKEFEIEKSADHTNFSGLGTVAATGNSNIEQQYSLIDSHPFSGANYYRLKSVDNDGTFSYSKTAEVDFGTKATISIYPNPATNYFTIQHPASNQAIITLTDVEGKKIKTVSIDAGSTSSTISIDGLGKGLYFVKYIDGGNASVATLVKE